MELRLLGAVCTAIYIYSNAAMAVSFTPLGDLTGGSFTSIASGVSGDGSVVVGQGSSASVREAFRWTSDGGMVGLGVLTEGDYSSRASGVSADGSVVVGVSDSASGSEAFRWTREDGMVGLGYLGPHPSSGRFASSASGVSADGSVIAGTSTSASGREAFRWTSEGSMVGLGDLAGGYFESPASGVSAGGSVIVGYSNSDSGSQAFRWTSDVGMVGLGYLEQNFPGEGELSSDANGVSGDGSVVVGESGYAFAEIREAFRWTSDGGMEGLGYLVQNSPIEFVGSSAQGVSADGSVVVGYSISDSSVQAFRWTSDGGMQSVASILTTAGVDLTGWRLESAVGVSADGNMIVGYGSNPDGATEAWIADLTPPPATTPVDLSGTIKTPDGTDICAMVLASGQYMFSCNPVGVFSLEDLPRESTGTVKCQMYADGFFPEITIVTESGSEAFVMTRSGTCPSYNIPYDPGFFPNSAGNRINISGAVLMQDTQTPICAMVLANGQYMFSCDGSGSYALNIPLDNNGQYKLQVYADGFAPTIQNFDEFQVMNDVRMARAVECQ